MQDDDIQKSAFCNFFILTLFYRLAPGSSAALGEKLFAAFPKSVSEVPIG